MICRSPPSSSELNFKNEACSILFIRTCNLQIPLKSSSETGSCDQSVLSNHHCFFIISSASWQYIFVLCLWLLTTDWVKALITFLDQLCNTSTSLAPEGPWSSNECGWSGGQRGEALWWWEAASPPPSLRSSSVMVARTGNQSTAALSAHAIGPAPTTMNCLSAALNVASLFNDKFGNVWISSLDHILVQWCS